MTTKEFEVQLALGTLIDDMKIDLASNPNTPIEILTILSIDKDYYARYYVANNPNTSKEVLTILSTDEYSGVRYYVANNPNTPAEVLKKLSTDEDSSVKYRADIQLGNK